jgi:hypothetical protein
MPTLIVHQTEAIPCWLSSPRTNPAFSYFIIETARATEYRCWDKKELAQQEVMIPMNPSNCILTIGMAAFIQLVLPDISIRMLTLFVEAYTILAANQAHPTKDNHHLSNKCDTQ